MLLNTVELRILEVLSKCEVRGTANLGDEAVPSTRTTRSRQGAALAVGRFIRSLSDKGLIDWYVPSGDKLSNYRITPAGRVVYEEARAALTAAGIHQPTAG